MRSSIHWFVLIGLATAASTGCSGLLRPYNYAQPGDARRQRSVAIAHDPYPLDDVGPEILGGRPLGFEKPLAEVQRARLYNPPLEPLKPLPIFEPTVITPIAPAPNPWPAPPPVQTIPAPYPPPVAFPAR